MLWLFSFCLQLFFVCFDEVVVLEPNEPTIIFWMWKLVFDLGNNSLTKYIRTHVPLDFSEAYSHISQSLQFWPQEEATPARLLILKTDVSFSGKFFFFHYDLVLFIIWTAVCGLNMITVNLMRLWTSMWCCILHRSCTAYVFICRLSICSVQKWKVNNNLEQRFKL